MYQGLYWGNANAGSASSFSVSGDGAKTVSVRQTDAAGHIGASSGTQTFTLDTTTPDQTVSNVHLSADSGRINNDLVTNAAAQTITATLGIVLANGYASGTALDYAKLTASHISMGLGGWVMLLVAGVSYQVVPMFQLTPNYPKWLASSFSPALFAVLLLSLVARGYDIASLSTLAAGLFWLLAVSFAVITLRLQSQRRRRVADATLSFFRLGMSGLLCAALFSTLALYPPLHEDLTTLSVVIFITGFALSVIFGMLYKIVPFLVWFHLFRGGVKKGVPNMKSIIPEIWMWRHLQLHRITLLAILTAAVWNPASWLAITGLALQGVLLCYALYTAIAVYQRTLKILAATWP